MTDKEDETNIILNKKSFFRGLSLHVYCKKMSFMIRPMGKSEEEK
jgi:hypothetical protein